MRGNGGHGRGAHAHHGIAIAERRPQDFASLTRSAWRALSLLSGYLPQFIVTCILTLILTLCTLILPRLKQIGIDEGIVARNLSRLTQVALFIAAVHCLNVVAGIAQSILLNWLGQQAVHNLRCRLFSHLQRLSMDFFERREPGNIISRVINDMDAINELLTSGLISLFSDLVMLIGISVMLFRYHWKLALALHVILPLMAILAFIIQRHIHAVFMRCRETIAEVTAHLHETVAGIRVIKSLARESQCAAEFAKRNVENQNANIAAARLWATVFPILELVNAGGLIIIFSFGGILVLRHEITIGVAMAFVFYLNQWFDPVRRLTELFATFQRALVGIERIYEILDTEPTVRDAPDAIEAPPFSGRVRFENVGFTYDGTTKVLHNITLQADPGETVALVGATGAGKSTTIKLLTRMYDPQEGRITIDGYDIRKLTTESLRRQMAIVPQDMFLFSGTVGDNIRFAKPEASDEEVRRVASLVNAAEFIEQLPQGYETDVHERGVKLSVGQRQLIAFARALLANPRILILDEATSSVDRLTESYIQEATRSLLANRVSFVIAHRLSTIVNADKILVIDKGRIIDQGKHAELLTRCPLYRNLYERGFKEPEAFVQTEARNPSAPGDSP